MYNMQDAYTNSMTLTRAWRFFLNYVRTEIEANIISLSLDCDVAVGRRVEESLQSLLFLQGQNVRGGVLAGVQNASVLYEDNIGKVRPEE